MAVIYPCAPDAQLDRVRALDARILPYRGMDALFAPGPPQVITFVNTFSYYRLVDAPCPITHIDAVFIDGMLQVALHNKFVRRKTARASFDFSSLAHDFFSYAAANRWRVALVGATEAEVRLAAGELSDAYPDLAIGCFRNGYVHTDAERQALAQTLQDRRIDAVILGMGTPLQEQTAVFLKERLPRVYVVTCGGFITQTARGIGHYWKRWRWLQRAIEYSHVRERIFRWYPRNMVRYCIEHIALWLGGRHRKPAASVPDRG